VESTDLAVPEEQVFDGNPSLTECAIVLTNNVLELDGEHVEELGDNDVVHLPPAGESRGSGVGGDIVIEGVSLKRLLDEVRAVLFRRPRPMANTYHTARTMGNIEISSLTDFSPLSVLFGFCIALPFSPSFSSLFFVAVRLLCVSTLAYP
jgi:hypothetical protein